MIPIYYKSSEGEIVNLIEAPYMMLTDTEILNYSWEWETSGINFPKISALKKSLVSSSFSIVVSGSSKADMMDNVEYLTSIFDGDCYRGEMGRIYIGNFYRNCFITSSSKSKIFEQTTTTIQFVATSDDANWKYEKEISFSGSGALVGEIADKMYVSASHRSEYIIYTPQADHTAHLEWSDYGSGDHWLRFDLGGVTQIAEFSGITLQSTGIPISCDLQISNGETVDDSRSINVSTGAESTQILVDDFTEITIDDYGESGWQNVELRLYGYSGETKETKYVSAGDTIDVSAYDKISFLVNYIVIAQPTTVAYTVNEQQWTTIESYSSYADPVNVEAENIECSSIRLRGNYIGDVNADLSVVSDEQSPLRNLLDLGYQFENVSEERTDIPDDVYVFWSIRSGLDCFVYFDDTNVELKSIVTGSMIEVTGTLQGFVNDEWVDIADIEQNMDETYNEHYDRLRIHLYENDSEFNLSNFNINVTTDAKVYNESYAPSEAIIEISEMHNNPSVMIGNNEYGANIELQANHTLVIDTKNKTTMVYSEDGTAENVFDKRLPDTFEKVESGEQDVTWGGNAEIKITLEQARSDPKWN